MIQHSTVEWSVARCVGDGLAAASDVIRAAAPAKGEYEDNESPGNVWSVCLLDYNRQAGRD